MKRSQSERLIATQLNNAPTIFAEAILIGILAGLISVVYRFLLTYAEKAYFMISSYVHDHMIYLVLWIPILLVVGFLISLLLKWEPYISGSGIPQVEAEVQGRIDMKWWRVLLAKIIGGTLAVFGGLSVGREGPSIQLGAMIGKGIGKKFRQTANDIHYLMTCGASAGLAAAFNAPLAGIMFALEEVHKSFNTKAVMSVMCASVIADFISRNVFGLAPVLSFTIEEVLPLRYYGWLVVLGLVTGALGVLYNKLTMTTIAVYKKIPLLQPHQKVMIPLLISSILGLYAPILMCGGGAVLTRLDQPDLMIGALILMYLGKLAFSACSFGSGAPGGIFFPLLILGSLVGAIVGKAAISLGLPEVYYVNFIIFAMAGYFSAIVRAPITGIVLIAEMSGTLRILLPMVLTCFISYSLANGLHSEPIYESLLHNLLAKQRKQTPLSDIHKSLVSYVIAMDAIAAHKKVADLILDQCLIVSVIRGNTEFIPNGETVLHPADQVIVLVNKDNIIETKEMLRMVFTSDNE
ncbi:MAG: ClC family H(+)/Cl(-) exchange transporter [Erysipelotrichaceae bacterium]|nr:ClC family H(+)/Cl(-) exchange transporter [Erysipelotrichaceae bacterium]